MKKYYSLLYDSVCGECADLIELPVGAENERQDVKHFDPNHSSTLVPFRETMEEKQRLQQCRDPKMTIK